MSKTKTTVVKELSTHTHIIVPDDKIMAKGMRVMLDARINDEEPIVRCLWEEPDDKGEDQECEMVMSLDMARALCKQLQLVFHFYSGGEAE